MFQQAVAKISSRAKVALFIDGLDGFDGDCKVLISLLKECVSSPIKLCVASRPWNEFSDAFQHNPSLRMEELTRHDIKKYVVARFGKNPRFQRLQQREAKFAHNLIEHVVKKANGVFLWVTVVVASLSSGMADGDRIEDLESVLDHLQTELEKLYETIVGGIKTRYLEHAVQYFRLMNSSTAPPSLLLFWYADEENLMERVLHDEFETAPDMEIQGRLEDMRRRLSSRCRGLLKVHNNTPNPTCPELGGTVRYLHKTVAEFVSSPLGKLKLIQLLGAEYDPNFRLAAVSVAVVRTIERCRRLKRLDDLSLFEPCISSRLCYASMAAPESRREILQLMNTLRRSLTYSTLRKNLPGQSFDDLSREAQFLCMATQGLVLEYTMANAPRGCLIESTPPSKPKSRNKVVQSSIQSLRGIPEGPALSLLSLTPLTDHRSYDTLQYLLSNGAKLKISFNRISAVQVRQATPWEEILAKAIRAFGDGVGYDEKENVSKCLRLMIDRGAKVKDYTVKNAFRLAHGSRNYSLMSGPPLVRRWMRFGSDTIAGYLRISPDRVYNALKSMKKDSSMPFRL
ncbi:hypothetical protein N3K66_001600 [Trichothecium roseum]|uniref:Uncharacterized protein n=1 Tax=Trichothecium roseum TaxID=47278 RepID=A0ACC0VF65_9HYPO|nr:hypothetical protein N3K66_001600 [Trichothecium roseum]